MEVLEVMQDTKRCVGNRPWMDEQYNPKTQEDLRGEKQALDDMADRFRGWRMSPDGIARALWESGNMIAQPPNDGPPAGVTEPDAWQRQEASSLEKRILDAGKEEEKCRMVYGMLEKSLDEVWRPQLKVIADHKDWSVFKQLRALWKCLIKLGLGRATLVSDNFLQLLRELSPADCPAKVVILLDQIQAILLKMQLHHAAVTSVIDDEATAAARAADPDADPPPVVYMECPPLPKSTANVNTLTAKVLPTQQNTVILNILHNHRILRSTFAIVEGAIREHAAGLVATEPAGKRARVDSPVETPAPLALIAQQQQSQIYHDQAMAYALAVQQEQQQQQQMQQQMQQQEYDQQAAMQYGPGQAFAAFRQPPPIYGRASSSPGVCYAYQRGECTRGASCRFQHGSNGIPPPSLPLPPAPASSGGARGAAGHPSSSSSSSPCTFFQQGRCQLGDQCRFRHEGLPGALANNFRGAQGGP